MTATKTKGVPMNNPENEKTADALRAASGVNNESPPKRERSSGGAAMRVFRVKDWDRHYENNRSRTVKDLAWVPVPNRHDGEGFSTVMAHERGAEIFAAFILILQVASRCQPRGTLMRDGSRPHTPESLALKTRAKAEWFALAFDFLCSPDVGWLEVVEVPESLSEAFHSHQPDTAPSASCQPAASVVTKKGMEGNGMKEGEGSSPAVLRIAMEKELGRITRELERLGKPGDYHKDSQERARILELRQRQAVLRRELGVKA